MDILILLVAIGVGGGLMIVPWIGLKRPGKHSMAKTAFVEVGSIAELDAVFAKSQLSSQLIFLHDPWCPMSAMAFRQLAGLGGRVRTVDVSQAHQLSSVIADRTGIRHESPQAILIAEGSAVWSAAHSAIKCHTIALTMGKLAQNQASPRDAVSCGHASRGSMPRTSARSDRSAEIEARIPE